MNGFRFSISAMGRSAGGNHLPDWPLGRKRSSRPTAVYQARHRGRKARTLYEDEAGEPVSLAIETA